MKFATDENFDGKILRGLQSSLPELDIVRVQDTVMYQSTDPDLLEWLATEDRILLTHDKATIPKYFYERIELKKLVSGVIIVIKNTPINIALDELELLIGAGEPEDFHHQIKYIPLNWE